MTDIAASLFCAVHGEVTTHFLLSDNTYECAEPLGNAGVCGEVRQGADAASETQHGEPAPVADWCPSCGCIPSRYGDLKLLPTGCPLCGEALPSTAEESS